MILIDFLELAIEDDYEINVYDCDTCENVARQVSIRDLKMDEEYDKYLDMRVWSWDIDYATKEFCVNIGDDSTL